MATVGRPNNAAGLYTVGSCGDSADEDSCVLATGATATFNAAANNPPLANGPIIDDAACPIGHNLVFTRDDQSTAAILTETNTDSVQLTCANAALSAKVTINGVATDIAGDITSIGCADPIDRTCHYEMATIGRPVNTGGGLFISGSCGSATDSCVLEHGGNAAFQGVATNPVAGNAACPIGRSLIFTRDDGTTAVASLEESSVVALTCTDGALTAEVTVSGESITGDITAVACTSEGTCFYEMATVGRPSNAAGLYTIGSCGNVGTEDRCVLAEGAWAVFTAVAGNPDAGNGPIIDNAACPLGHHLVFTRRNMPTMIVTPTDLTDSVTLTCDMGDVSAIVLVNWVPTDVAGDITAIGCADPIDQNCYYEMATVGRPNNAAGLYITGSCGNAGTEDSCILATGATAIFNAAANNPPAGNGPIADSAACPVGHNLVFTRNDMSTVVLLTETTTDTVELSCTNAALAATVSINGVTTDVTADVTSIACADPIDKTCHYEMATIGRPVNTGGAIFTTGSCGTTTDSCTLADGSSAIFSAAAVNPIANNAACQLGEYIIFVRDDGSTAAVEPAETSMVTLTCNNAALTATVSVSGDTVTGDIVAIGCSPETRCFYEMATVGRPNNAAGLFTAGSCNNRADEDSCHLDGGTTATFTAVANNPPNGMGPVAENAACPLGHNMIFTRENAATVTVAPKATTDTVTMSCSQGTLSAEVTLTGVATVVASDITAIGCAEPVDQNCYYEMATVGRPNNAAGLFTAGSCGNTGAEDSCVLADGATAIFKLAADNPPLGNGPIADLSACPISHNVIFTRDDGSTIELQTETNTDTVELSCNNAVLTATVNFGGVTPVTVPVTGDITSIACADPIDTYCYYEMATFGRPNNAPGLYTGVRGCDNVAAEDSCVLPASTTATFKAAADPTVGIGACPVGYNLLFVRDTMSPVTVQTRTAADMVELSCTNAALTATVTVNGADTAVTGDITAVACTYPCPPGWQHLHTATESICYQLSEDTATFDNANTLCEQRGGTGATLAIIKTSEEINFILSYIPLLNDASIIHVGGSDTATEADWRWLDGTAVDVTVHNFQPPEPNGGTNENCLAIGSAADQKYVDQPCTTDANFLCQKALVAPP